MRVKCRIKYFLPGGQAPGRESSYSSELSYRDIWRTLCCLGCGVGRARSMDSEIQTDSNRLADTVFLAGLGLGGSRFLNVRIVPRIHQLRCSAKALLAPNRRLRGASSPSLSQHIF